jgi:protein-S-isoprenylcysteine O-methyltransferase Ste14
MNILLTYVVRGLWLLFYAIWLLAAQRVKETQRVETSFSRQAILLITILGYAMTLTSWFHVGPLALRFVPHTLGWVLAGVVIEALGIGFALVARVYLGRNWSGKVTIKVDHELISNGPYRLTRNPIYTGIITGVLGTAIAYGFLSGLVGLAMVLVAHLWKISEEERFLSEQFGPAYAEYRRRVKALIPFIW